MKKTITNRQPISDTQLPSTDSFGLSVLAYIVG